MPEQDQDILSKSLLRLQEELTSFGKVHGALKTAHEELIKAELEWKDLTVKQQLTAQDLVGATKAAIAATHAVTLQAETLAGALLPLAKAIENVNFPLRLDKIDMAVSTQASMVSSLQATTERNLTNLQDRIAKADDTMSHGFAAMKASADIAGKKHKTIIELLILTMLLVVGGIVLSSVR